MAREFELKYAATPEDLVVLKEKYPHLRPITMETTYYDSMDGRLGELHWTLRRRMENGVSVCTLKVPGKGFGCGEWETECDDIYKALPILIAMDAPKELAELTAVGLQEFCGARFTRLAGYIACDGCTVELALDQGVLLGGGKELPFSEVEVELKSGSEEAAVLFGKALAQVMHLKPESRSKVARARGLAGQ